MFKYIFMMRMKLWLFKQEQFDHIIRHFLRTAEAGLHADVSYFNGSEQYMHFIKIKTKLYET